MTKKSKIIASIIAVCLVTSASVCTIVGLTSCYSEPVVEKGLKFSQITNEKYYALEDVNILPELKLDGKVLNQENKVSGSHLVFEWCSNTPGVVLPEELEFDPLTGTIHGKAINDVPKFNQKVIAHYRESAESESVTVESNEFSIEVDSLRFNQDVEDKTFWLNDTIVDEAEPVSLLFRGSNLPINSSVPVFSFTNGTGTNKTTLQGMPGIEINPANGTISGKVVLSQLPTPVETAIKASWNYQGFDFYACSNTFAISATPSLPATVEMDDVISTVGYVGVQIQNIQIPTPIITYGDEDVTSQCHISYELERNLPNGLEFDSDNLTISGTPTQITTNATNKIIVKVVGKYSAVYNKTFSLDIKSFPINSTYFYTGSSGISNNAIFVNYKVSSGDGTVTIPNLNCEGHGNGLVYPVAFLTYTSLPDGWEWINTTNTLVQIVIRFSSEELTKGIVDHDIEVKICFVFNGVALYTLATIHIRVYMDHN